MFQSAELFASIFERAKFLKIFLMVEPSSITISVETWGFHCPEKSWEMASERASVVVESITVLLQAKIRFSYVQRRLRRSFVLSFLYESYQIKPISNVIRTF